MIPSDIMTNFRSLKQAADTNNLVLVECADTNQFLLCSVDREFTLTTLGHLAAALPSPTPKGLVT